MQVTLNVLLYKGRNRLERRRASYSNKVRSSSLHILSAHPRKRWPTPRGPKWVLTGQG